MDMEIRLSSKLNLDYDALNSCTPYSGSIEFEGTNLGEIRFMRLIRQPGMDIEETLDLQMNDETQIDFLFDNYGDLRVTPRKAFDGDILCLAHLHILKPYRGLKLGYYIIQRVLRHFGSDCDVAIMDVKPLQYCSNPMFEDEFTDDFEGALEKLKWYYYGLGFRLVDPSWRGNNCRPMSRLKNHMYLDLHRYLFKKRRYDTIPEKISRILVGRVLKEKAEKHV